MFTRWPIIALMALAPALSLAATPPSEGTMAVDAKEIDAGQDLFRDAAASALADKGFTLLDGAGHAAFRMELAVSVTEVGTVDAKVATTGPKVQNGGLMNGVGSAVKIAVPTGKSRNVALERTQLDMTLRKRGETDILWRGSAVTVRNSATPGNIAADLSNALLRQYPVQSEGVIGVP
ncbi:hypothetical protein [Sphingobium sp. WCS2017Hpa-17]|uniref:hypothetical protein n=1 Tax=Sphingobium sp. WCS2017Hpa-17 TaxID=3073638 RepID=UPI00288BB825|nr:hypothetical protein [Sphingobium sp. WCS2017Hpa-17]